MIFLQYFLLEFKVITFHITSFGIYYFGLTLDKYFTYIYVLKDDLILSIRLQATLSIKRVINPSEMNG
jgi:hypothetical protein